MSSDSNTSTGPDGETVDEQAIRERVNTSTFETVYDELQAALDAIEDPLDPAEGVSPNEIVTLGDQLGNQFASIQRRKSQARREARYAARKAAESERDTDYLSGTLAATRAESDALPAIEEPRVVERDGRPIVEGECPITPVESARLVALDSGEHQDVFVLNQESDGAKRGPRADRSDSPLVETYHADGQCNSMDYPRRSYSLAGLGDAKRSGTAVPCPRCVLSVGTMQNALERAPALSEIPKGDGSDRVAYLTSGVDSNERDRHKNIVSYLTRNDGATAEEIGDYYGIQSGRVERDLRQMDNAGAVTYEQGDSGDTEWRLIGTGTG